ncbi:MAG: hypothetical protein EOP49_06910 [Sphingobacteriales bacterium]|nr:MAG: hypothetical protein EOP49_06910 [Sphingobacteriales bacterium]
MQSYVSLSGKKSGVTAFETGKDYILVLFENGGTYRYSYHSAGEQVVETLKELALRSKGLSTYISRYNPPYE